VQLFVEIEKFVVSERTGVIGVPVATWPVFFTVKDFAAL